MRSTIVDSGALVALFDPGDSYRPAIVMSLAKEPPSVTMLTTWPCVTEATDILARVEQQVAMLEFLHAGRCQAREFSTADLRRFIELIVKYGDHPMDFADASLVWLAGATGVRAILTTDRNDFERYRLPGGKRFEIL